MVANNGVNMNLPEWSAISQKVDDGIELSALETFIYYNEHCSAVGDDRFRRQLKELLDETATTSPNKQSTPCKEEIILDYAEGISRCTKCGTRLNNI